MAGRLVILLTSHRVPPGMLSARAWDELRDADEVALPDSHAQARFLAEAGVFTTPIPDDARRTAGDLARWLLDRADDQTLAFIAVTGAENELAPELSRLLVEDGPDVEVEALFASWDAPGNRLLDLVSVMDELRTECPWDRKQTHESLAKYLIEEAYETIDTIERGDPAALREELGDVLLQVMFHARVASERTDGTGFTIDDVAAGIVDKMVRRHPHVFGDVAVDGADDVTANWDEIKAAERAEKHGDAASALDDVPMGQPALALAAALQHRAGRAGLPEDLVPAGGDDLGARLFDLVAEADDDDPETALRATSRAFRDRFRRAESANPATDEEWRTAWNAG